MAAGHMALLVPDADDDTACSYAAAEQLDRWGLSIITSWHPGQPGLPDWIGGGQADGPENLVAVVQAARGATHLAVAPLAPLLAKAQWPLTAALLNSGDHGVFAGVVVGGVVDALGYRDGLRMAHAGLLSVTDPGLEATTAAVGEFAQALDEAERGDAGRCWDSVLRVMELLGAAVVR